MTTDPRKWTAYRLVPIVLAHVLLVTGSYAAAVALRFEFTLPEDEVISLTTALPVLVACRLVFFARYQLFRGWWQYVGVRDAVDIAKSTTAGSLTFVFVVVTTGAFPGFPRSLFLLEWLVTLHVVAGARVLSRLLHSLFQRARLGHRENVLIVGSGPEAESALRELRNNPSERRPIGFVDEGGAKRRGRMRGLPRLGSVVDLSSVLGSESVSEVLVAVAPEEKDAIRETARHCRSVGVPFRMLPSVREHLDRPRVGDPERLEQIFDVGDGEESSRGRDLFRDRRVLVLGAGGQIGRALAWKIIEARPQHLVLFDRNESPLYYLEVEFLKRVAAVPVTPVIGDVLDVGRLWETFSIHRPEIVVHAAAYTRTELIVRNFEEMARNNLGGLRNALGMAAEFGASRFLLLSCDESRNDPIACLHRVAEWQMREFAAPQRLIRVAVRFPEVIGSPGCEVTRAAVALHRQVPLVTSTSNGHVRIASIGSTSSLLLEALAIGEDGDVLVLDSGRTENLVEVLRYLGQVLNLAPVAVRSTEVATDHSHTPTPAVATANPRVLRRKREADPPPCLAMLRGVIDEGENGGTRLANPGGG